MFLVELYIYLSNSLFISFYIFYQFCSKKIISLGIFLLLSIIPLLSYIQNNKFYSIFQNWIQTWSQIMAYKYQIKYWTGIRTLHECNKCLHYLINGGISSRQLKRYVIKLLNHISKLFTVLIDVRTQYVNLGHTKIFE